jgi:hypothetical protein
MFKVGDRVHNNKEGYFCTILDIKETTNWAWVEKDNYDLINVNVNDLHQTAQTMFEALGFALMNQSIKGANYLQIKDCEIYPYNKDDKIQIVFYKEVEGYVVRSPLSDINGDIVIKLELHLAIHQKMIELGWL